MPRSADPKKTSDDRATIDGRSAWYRFGRRGRARLVRLLVLLRQGSATLPASVDRKKSLTDVPKRFEHV